MGWIVAVGSGPFYSGKAPKWCSQRSYEPQQAVLSQLKSQQSIVLSRPRLRLEGFICAHNQVSLLLFWGTGLGLIGMVGDRLLSKLP